MCLTDRFIVQHRREGPVYTSDRIDGVIAYLWGRDTSQYWVLVYETPVVIRHGDLEVLRRELYSTVLSLTYPFGTDTPV